MDARRATRRLSLTTFVSFGSPARAVVVARAGVGNNEIVSIDLEREKDPEILRQAAQLLEAENRRLVSRVMELTRELLVVQGRGRVALQLEIQSLQVELEKKNRMLFGSSSERRPADRPEDAAKPPKRGHGPQEQKELRVVDEQHVLDEDARTCPICRGSLEEMKGQFEESEEIDVIAREFVRKKHRRQKYRCSCNECIEAAPMPARLVPGGRYSTAFAIAVDISKYADHLPLERQVRIMRREGLVVESQTLYDQIESAARALWPAYDRLGATLLEERVLMADETRWPVLGKGHDAAKWHAWTMASPKGTYYEIHDTRGLKAGKSLLAGFTGIVVTDGYGVYDALEKQMPGLRIAQCWVHIRRNFVNCQTAFPKETEEILAMIAELYAIDGRAPPGRAGDDERRQLRNSESRCVLARIQAWCVGVHCTPGSWQSARGRHRIHVAALVEGVSLLGRSGSAARHQWCRTCAPRTGARTEESLRLTLASRDGSGRGVLFAHRVCKARRHRSARVPDDGHRGVARRPRATAPARTRRGLIPQLT